MIPPWLVAVLDDELPNVVGAERERIAERIVEAIPGRAIAKVIATSAQAVLATRKIRDDGGDLCREIGNNAAQTVLVTLAGDA